MGYTPIIYFRYCNYTNKISKNLLKESDKFIKISKIFRKVFCYRYHMASEPNKIKVKQIRRIQNEKLFW